MKYNWVYSHALFTLLGVALIFSICVPAGAQQREYVKVNLIADSQTVEPGKTLRLGVLFAMPRHGHIYWRFPGSSGLATGIEWALPAGFKVSELHWPNPARFEIKEIDDVTYGYETEVLLFADVTPPPDFDSTKPIAISADPYWLVCLDSGQCIPEGKKVRLELFAGKAISSRDAEVFENYASRVPISLDDTLPITVLLADAETGALRFEARAPWRFALDERDAPARFFPEEGGPWELSRPSPAEEGGETTLEFRCMGERPEDLLGVATLPMRNPVTGEKRAFYIRLNR